MFEIGKEYKVIRIYNGRGEKGEFAFIGIEYKTPKMRYGDRLTVCVWGNQVGVAVNDSIIIKAVSLFGNKPKKNDKNEWVSELQCNCKLADLEIVHSGMQSTKTNDAPPKFNELPVDEDDKLPF